MAKLEQLKEAMAVLDADNPKKHQPPIYTCYRCGKGVADPKIFLNGRAVHFPICLPDRLMR